MHEQLGRLHRPCGFAIPQAIKDAGTSLHDELAEHEAGADARELTDGFHSSLPGSDLPFGRARARQSSTHLARIPRSLPVPEPFGRAKGGLKPWLPVSRFLRSFAPHAEFVTLRQTFVRRSHGGKIAPGRHQHGPWSSQASTITIEARPRAFGRPLKWTFDSPPDRVSLITRRTLYSSTRNTALTTAIGAIITKSPAP